MDVVTDLKNLQTQAVTEEAKNLLGGEIARLEQEAKTLADEARAAVTGIEQHVAAFPAEAQAHWAKISAWLKKVL